MSEQTTTSPSMTETQLWEWMMDGNYPPGETDPFKREHRTATATLSRDIEVTKHDTLRRTEKKEIWKAGKRVKVVMASRFGDVGITDDLTAEYGYHYRTPCVEDTLEGPMGSFPIKPAGLLLDIKPD